MRYWDGANKVEYEEDKYHSDQHRSECLSSDNDRKDNKDMSKAEVCSGDSNLMHFQPSTVSFVEWYKYGVHCRSLSSYKCLVMRRFSILHMTTKFCM
jgi:hypothetical protein